MVKSAKTKIAFTGTNSSGKTTMALKVTAILKEQHHLLAEVVSSQDRKITWKDEHFPVNPIAHYGMITNLIHAEVQATLKGDADVIITDRSVLDLYAIALYDHPDSQLIKSLEPAIKAWVSTYSKIYLLEPLPYQEDGKRPSDTFRLATYQTLIKYIESNYFPNLVLGVDRSDIVKNVKADLGILVQNPLFEEKAKFLELAKSTKTNLLVKPTTWGSSDIDVWFLTEEGLCKASEVKDSLLSLAKLIFGDQIVFDFMYLPSSVDLTAYEQTHKIYLGITK